MAQQRVRRQRELEEAAKGKRPVRLPSMAERYIPQAPEKREAQVSEADSRLQVRIPQLTVDILPFRRESLLRESAVDERHQAVTLPLTAVT